MKPEISFFYYHAGFAQMPGEKIKDAKLCIATQLARAEAWAKNACVSFVWSVDPDTDSSDFADGEPWQLWQCLAYDADGNIIASLGGVDFGRDGSPCGDNYRRVVEAELALEAMPA